ncbi:copper-binding protein [Klebsiella sp. BIGb0407]|uniref:copper-binding protein n=1 Tax=Klebsiella sp. BIGb0407 TaxID=2940603 RepID=UPI002169FD88|nr:copper-binding protein [Klebsiella sp. BIGb0407]MCS3429972.1 Cu(I)/Ag(I) efflux system protein CusF [Klebsiella sp. BIGb0407]
MNQLIKIVSASFLSLTVAYAVQANETHHNMHAEASNTQAAMSNQVSEPLHQTTGVIKGIDNKQQKMSISHEAIPEISWPPMTMNFIFTPVADKVSKLKSGEAINFSFTQQGNDYVLQSIEVK